MSNEADAKKLYLSLLPNVLRLLDADHKQIAIIAAFLDARDSKPPMSEEVREALAHEETGKCWPKCNCDYENAECDARAMSILAAEIRRLRGETK